MPNSELLNKRPVKGIETLCILSLSDFEQVTEQKTRQGDWDFANKYSNSSRGLIVTEQKTRQGDWDLSH